MSQDAEIKPRDIQEILNAIVELTGESLATVQALYEQAKHGATMAEMFKIPQESLDAGYVLACSLFTSGKIHDAEIMFRALCQYDERQPKNWLGLGCCFEKQGGYEEAIFCYAHSADLDTSPNPKTLFLLAQCCCAVRRLDAAKKVLSLAVTVGDSNDPGQMRYRKLAQELLSNINAE
ncbi:MAG: hypothetical protein IJU79_01570 [Desulfovibrionaceae bacterium]|nr:hypothetical protein [Desulfovibrionaceae bacterium]